MSRAVMWLCRVMIPPPDLAPLVLVGVLASAMLRGCA